MKARAIGEKDSLATILFGKNNLIRYHLNSGTWDVLFNGKPVITGAYAIYKEGVKEISTKELGAGKYIELYKFGGASVRGRY